MLHKFRLLITTVALTILLIACGSETNDNAESTDQALDSVEVQSEEASTADTNNETTESETDTATEDPASPKEAPVEEERVAEAAEESETDSSETETNEETTEDNKDASFQVAVQKILEATDLNAEDYVFTFENTEDYIEVEVREKSEDEVTPLEGIYRYFPETDELLISDYLTGEFIPYDDVE